MKNTTKIVTILALELVLLFSGCTDPILKKELEQARITCRAHCNSIHGNSTIEPLNETHIWCICKNTILEGREELLKTICHIEGDKALCEEIHRIENRTSGPLFNFHCNNGNSEDCYISLVELTGADELVMSYPIRLTQRTKPVEEPRLICDIKIVGEDQ